MSFSIFVFSRAGLVMFSIFGLVSCMPDQRPVPDFPDSFSIPRPQLRDPISGAPPVPLVDRKSVRANQEVLLSTHKGTPTEGVKLSLTSTCNNLTHPNIREEVQLTFNLDKDISLPVRELLPTFFWKKVDWEPDELLHCDLSIHASNSRGSVLSGKRTLIVSDLSSLENLAASSFAVLDESNFDAESNSPPRLVVHSLQNSSTQSVPFLNRGAILEVICERFRRKSQIQNVESLSIALFRLLQDKQSSGAKPIEVIDSRQAQPLQNCRVFIESPELPNALPQVQVSSIFKAQFTPPQNLMVGSLEMERVGLTKKINGYPIYKLKIQNKSPIPSAYRINNAEAGAVSLYHVSGKIHDKTYLSSQALTASLQFDFAGEGYVQAASDHYLLVINPGQEASFTASLRSGFNCLWRSVPDAHGFKKGQSGFVGFMVGFKRHDLVRRFYRWDTDSPDPLAETFDITEEAFNQSPWPPARPGFLDKRNLKWLPALSWKQLLVPQPEAFRLMPVKTGLPKKECASDNEILLYKTVEAQLRPTHRRPIF
jgi:hypothetical protein